MRRSPMNLSEVVKSPMSGADGCADGFATKRWLFVAQKGLARLQLQYFKANAATAAFKSDLFRIFGRQRYSSNAFEGF